MTKRGYAWPVPALLVVASLMGPGEANAQEPQGWLGVREDSLPLMLMGRCWEEEGRANCVDTEYMFLEPHRLDLTEVEVQPGQTMSVRFSLQPTKLAIWPHNGRRFEEDPSLDPLRFAAPLDPGIYYYAVAAEWEPGSGMWMFKIRVGQPGRRKYESSAGLVHDQSPLVEEER